MIKQNFLLILFIIKYIQTLNANHLNSLSKNQYTAAYMQEKQALKQVQKEGQVVS